ncbi:phage protein NinX family protein [Enterobacter ludwigii]|uniref:phage protein NinX family protein n=1 Tax=Enterobacter ludwigii TaxID=299767 RepID=UPI0022E3591B|nr:phage protein NinX family protein [Enterobacter ludwigii]
MDYSLLSDFEINKLVAKATSTSVEETYQFVNGGEDIADHMSGIVLMRKISSNRKHWKLYDPCNNAADAWPIIVDNKINIRFGAEGMACEAQFIQYGHESVEFYHGNPLRAAMIVFLMMRDEK